MFNWICPQCGSEVLASYSECPECAKRATQSPAQTQTVPQAAPAPIAPPPTRVESPYSGLFTAPPAVQQPSAPMAAAPQQPYYPQPPQYYPPPQYGAPQYAAPQPRAGLPTWLMS